MPIRPSDTALKRDWKTRWEAKISSRRDPERAADRTLDKAFDGAHLELYNGLTKAQSSVLVQARTGKIGLQAFLVCKKVPSIATPICPCGTGPQTPEHLFAYCNHVRSQGLRDMGFLLASEVQKGLSNHQTAGKMAKAILRSGWLAEFQLSEQLRMEEDLEKAQVGWTRKPPPERGKGRPWRPVSL